MVINRGASFVLPLSLKPLIDGVMNRGDMAILLYGSLLRWLARPCFRGVTSYAP